MFTINLLTTLTKLLTQEKDRPTLITTLQGQIQQAYGQPGVIYLEQVLTGLGLISTPPMPCSTDPLPASALPYQTFIKPNCYQTLLAFCQLAYLMENNGIATDHAFKLAVVFANPSAAFAYLIKRANTKNPEQMLVHDACLFDLPSPDTCEFRQWQRLACVHLAHPRFRELLPHAANLEKIGQLGRHAPQTPRSWTRAQLIELKVQGEQVAKAVKAYKDKQGKAPVNPTLEQRAAFDKEVSELSQHAADLRAQFVDHCQQLKFSDLSLTVLEAFYHVHLSQANTAQQHLVRYWLTPATIALFYTLTPITSDSVIPAINIDGDQLGYCDYYLQKLGTREEETALAACLGKITNCCQYLGGIGHDCAIHGITSANGGFYVMRRRMAPPATLAESIVAQAWVWYSREGILCFDSIEAIPDADVAAVQTLFRALAHRLCQQYGIKQVNAGNQSGITKKVAHNYSPETIAHCIDYTGYSDAKAQRSLAAQTMPYLFFDATSTTALQTLIQHDTQTFIRQQLALATPLHNHEPLKQLIAFSLSTNNQPLLNLVTTQIATERQAELAELVAINRHYIDQLGRKIIDLAALSQGAYLHAQNADGQSALHVAVLANNRTALTALMAHGIDGNRQDKQGNTALMVALVERVYSNKMPKKYQDDARALANDLLTHGVDVDIKNKDEKNPLLLAITHHDLILMQQLLKQGADINVLDGDMRTPLFHAVMQNQDAMVRLLLSYHPKLNTVDSCQKTPLMVAVQNQHADMTQLLLSQPGVQLYQRDKLGANVLHQAIYHHDDDLAIQLIERSCPINDVSDKVLNSGTALYWAVKKRLERVVASLLIHRANPNTASPRNGKTPLMAAVDTKTVSNTIVTLLVNCSRTNLNAVDNEGKTALNYAINHQRTTLAEVLLNKGALIDANKTGLSPLLQAIRLNNEALVRLLLTYHPNLDVVNAHQQTPLLQALAAKQTTIASLVLAQPDCPVQSKDNTGKTALHYAIYCHDPDLIERLLARGGAVDAQDNKGQTALWLTAAMKNSPIMDSIMTVLLAYKAQVNIPDTTKQQTPLIAAILSSSYQPLEHAQQPNKKTIALLLNQPTIDLNHRDKAGFAALHHAVIEDDLRLVRDLLDAGVDLELEDSHGRTALWWAVTGNQTDMINFLLFEKNANCNIIDCITQQSLLMTMSELSSNQEPITSHLFTHPTIALDHQDNTGTTALHYAIKAGNKAFIQQLIEHGANLGVCDNDGRTALWWAAHAGDSKTVSLLLANTAHLNTPDKTHQQTPLMVALRKRDSATAKLLLMQPTIDVDQRDKDDMTALHYINDEQDELFINMLIDKSKTLDAKDNQGRTPLWCAVAEGQLLKARLLLAQQTNVNNIHPDSQQTLLIMALVKKYNPTANLLSGQGSMEIRQLVLATTQRYQSLVDLLLVQPSIELHHQDKDGLTALHHAIKHNDEALAQRFIDNSSHIDCWDKAGKTPLWWAVEKKEAALVASLLSKQAEPNSIDPASGKTALMEAFEQKHTAIACLLLAQPTIDLHHVTNEGLTVLHYSSMIANNTIIEHLQRHLQHTKLPIDACSSTGDTPLFWAIRYNNQPLVRLLLDNHAQINRINNEGETPLMMAIHDNNIAIAALLLQQPTIDIHQRNRQGSPLKHAIYCASHHRNITLVKLLLEKGADNDLSVLYLSLQGNMKDRAAFFQAVFMLYPENKRLAILLKSNEKQPLFNKVFKNITEYNNMALFPVIITALPAHHRLLFLTHLAKLHDLLWYHIINMPDQLSQILDSLPITERFTALTITTLNGETLVELVADYANSLNVILAALSESEHFALLTMPLANGGWVADCLAVQALSSSDTPSAVKDYVVLHQVLKPFYRANTTLDFFAGNAPSLVRLAQQVRRATSFAMVGQAVMTYVAQTPEVDVCEAVKQCFVPGVSEVTRGLG